MGVLLVLLIEIELESSPEKPEGKWRVSSAALC